MATFSFALWKGSLGKKGTCLGIAFVEVLADEGCFRRVAIDRRRLGLRGLGLGRADQDPKRSALVVVVYFWAIITPCMSSIPLLALQDDRRLDLTMAIRQNNLDLRHKKGERKNTTEHWVSNLSSKP
jgi:hypothetical protein